MLVRISTLSLLSLLLGLGFWPLTAVFGALFPGCLHPCQSHLSGSPGAVGAWIVIGMAMGIGAIAVGMEAIRDIRRRDDGRRGKWVARVGMILGAFSFLSFLGIPELLVANERHGIRTELKMLHQAETEYRHLYPEVGFSPDLASLGRGPDGSERSAAAAWLLSDDLAAGRLCGGRDPLRYAVRRDPHGVIVGFTATGGPHGVAYSIDETGVIGVGSVDRAGTDSR